MTAALLYASHPISLSTIADDLAVAGISVLASVRDVTKLVQAVVLHAPDVVVCDEPYPSRQWFEAIALLEAAAACPVLVFTTDTDAGHIAQSVASGIHVYAVDGYSANRLRPMIVLAQARFQREQQQRKAFAEMSTRLEERKVVDRAKGILMHAQHLSDDDAFRVLRTSAMRSNQRMGQLSQQVIQSARVAESLNRAGQLRMLSQRIVKLHLLSAACPDRLQHAQNLQASLDWVDGNVALLRKTISLATFGDLLEQVQRPWQRLKAALVAADASVDTQAQALLDGAERLTAQLEAAGHVAPLHLLNLAGRQRMLSQRYAKFALQLLAPTVYPAAAVQAGMRAAQQEFESALTAFNAMPLTSVAIAQTLQAAGIDWLRMVAAANALQDPTAPLAPEVLDELASGSERLLQHFEQLAAHYESSLEMLVG